MRAIRGFGQSSRRRGSSIVEASLVLLLFLLVVAGLLELGRGVWAYTTIAHASRQGARWAMVHGQENPATSYQVTEAVRNAAIGLERNRVQVTTIWPTDIERGKTVRVQVRYPFELVSGSLLLPGSTIQISANSAVILAN